MSHPYFDPSRLLPPAKPPSLRASVLEKLAALQRILMLIGGTALVIAMLPVAIFAVWLSVRLVHWAIRHLDGVFAS